MTTATQAAWLSQVTARSHAALTPSQRANNLRFVRRQDPPSASLLQIGANTHESTSFRTGSGVYDVGPDAVHLGWRSTLVEPLPTHFAALRARYATNPRVRLINGAVCDVCDEANAAALDFYFVDVTNATGNHGSRLADARCLAYAGAGAKVVPEIASLTMRHVLKHERIFASSPKACAQCSRTLGYADTVDLATSRSPPPLPKHCLRHVLRDNVRSQRVPCYCASNLVDSSSSKLTLLLVDAEGHDAKILRRFPLDRVHVDRITFEAQHTPNELFRELGDWLLSNGFALVFGGFKAPLSTWHRINATT